MSGFDPRAEARRALQAQAGSDDPEIELHFRGIEVTLSDKGPLLLLRRRFGVSRKLDEVLRALDGVPGAALARASKRRNGPHPYRARRQLRERWPLHGITPALSPRPPVGVSMHGNFTQAMIDSLPGERLLLRQEALTPAIEALARQVQALPHSERPFMCVVVAPASAVMALLITGQIGGLDFDQRALEALDPPAAAPI